MVDHEVLEQGNKYILVIYLVEMAGNCYKNGALGHLLGGRHLDQRGRFANDSKAVVILRLIV